jgi:hypothetical protein
VTDDVTVCIQYKTLLTCSGYTILDRLVPMADSENSDSPQIRLFRECSHGFLTSDPVLLTKAMHKDYRCVNYPRSLSKPEQTREELIEHWAEIVSFWVAVTEVSYVGCPSDPLHRN